MLKFFLFWFLIINSINCNKSIDDRLLEIKNEDDTLQNIDEYNENEIQDMKRTLKIFKHTLTHMNYINNSRKKRSEKVSRLISFYKELMTNNFVGKFDSNILILEHTDILNEIQYSVSQLKRIMRRAISIMSNASQPNVDIYHRFYDMVSDIYKMLGLLEGDFIYATGILNIIISLTYLMEIDQLGNILKSNPEYNDYLSELKPYFIDFDPVYKMLIIFTILHEDIISNIEIIKKDHFLNTGYLDNILIIFSNIKRLWNGYIKEWKFFVPEVNRFISKNKSKDLESVKKELKKANLSSKVFEIVSNALDNQDKYSKDLCSIIYYYLAKKTFNDSILYFEKSIKYMVLDIEESTAKLNNVIENLEYILSTV